MQAGAYGDADIAGVTPHDDLAAIQEAINYIYRWYTVSTMSGGDFDCDRRLIKLIVPANRTFQVDTTAGTGLVLAGPITIEGEDRDTSRLKLLESGTTSGDLFKATNLQRIAFRNFTMEGSYLSNTTAQGNAQLVRLSTVDGVTFENVTLTHNRGVVVGGDRVRNLTMRGCLISESRKGGLSINDALNIIVEDNDFRWMLDDPVALTISNLVAPDGTPTQGSRNDGGMIRVVGNRCFGTRGINISGAKTVIVAENTHTLGRGRAIHIGTSTFQQKGDTSSLNIVVRNNIVTDLLNATVDPRFDPTDPDSTRGGCRAIDIELLFAAPGGATANIPGLPGNNYPVLDPTAYYYTDAQGAQGAPVWKKDLAFPRPDGTLRTWWDGRFYKTTAGGTTGSTPPTGTTTFYDGGVNWMFDG